MWQISSNSSDDTSSLSSNLRRRKGIRMGTTASLSDPDVSSSEQSVDTVIFVPDGSRHQRYSHRARPNVYTPVAMPTQPRTSPNEYVKTTPNGQISSIVSPYSATGKIRQFYIIEYYT